MSKNKVKTANLLLESQVVAFRATRRGRTGGKLIAPSMEALQVLVDDKGWSGDIKVQKVFISAENKTT